MKPRLEPVPVTDTENALRLIHFIGGSTALPAAAAPAALGLKAWNLARMAAVGLPVPPAFVLGTGWCGCAEVGPPLWQGALQELERFTGLGLGDTRHPLLLSVRSGAAVSMPGMMDTLLNIGLTDATLPGMVRLTGHPRLARDAYRRLIAGYGEVVAGIDPQHFEADLDAVRADNDERELDFAAFVRWLTVIWPPMPGRPVRLSHRMRRCNCARQSLPSSPPGPAPRPGPIVSSTACRTRWGRQ